MKVLRKTADRYELKAFQEEADDEASQKEETQSTKKNVLECIH